MKWQLLSLMGEGSSRTGERITYDMISEATKISQRSLSHMATGKQKRVDVDALFKLRRFFSEKLGRPVLLDELVLEDIRKQKKSS